MIKYLILIFGAMIATPHNSIFGQKKQRNAEITPNYNITLNLQGAKPNDTVYLITSFGTQQYASDTAIFDAKSTAIFNKKKLHEGIGGIMLQNRAYLEIVLPKNQNFIINTSTADLLLNAKFENSPENTRFITYIQQAQKNRQEAQQRIVQQKSTVDLDSIFEKNRVDFIQKNTDDLIAKILNMSQEPNINGYKPMKPNGDTDTAAIAYRYRQLYWQNTDFTDDRLLYSLAFEPKLMNYIEKFVSQTADSLNIAADFLIEKTKPSPEMYEFMLRKLASIYEQPKIMGTDAVFVHIIEKYFTDTKAVPFITEPDLLRIKQKAQATKPALIGNTAPDIALTNEMGQEISVYALQKKVNVLYFYDPNCGKCQKFTPEVFNIYQKYQTNPNVAFIAICNAPEEANWRKYIIDKKLTWVNLYDFSGRYLYRYAYDIAQVPRIVITDKNHKIIGKNLDADTLDLFLKNQLK